jgi:membrane protein DedA with SNARE-associated domain
MLSLDALRESLMAVLQGQASPALIAVVLALTTLLLEDLAIAAGVALATQGALSWALSLAAVGGGIAIGDIGLYALGLGATRWPWLQRHGGGPRADWIRARLAGRLPSAVLLARVVPGLRLLTYTACGFMRVPLLAFVLWVLLAVSLWTLGLYGLSVAAGHALAQHLGLPPAVAVALPVGALALVIPLLRRLRERVQPLLKVRNP